MTVETMTLAEFLLERIAEDERAAQKLATLDRRPVLSLATTANHPERLLLECEAKRRIVELYRSWDENTWEEPAYWSAPMDEVLATLARPYADHPDYLPEWQPE